MSCSHSRSRDQHSIGGHLREVRWTVTPSKGKDSDSSDSRQNSLFLFFDLFPRFFWIFSFSFSPSSVVVFNFIGTKKSSYAFELFKFFIFLFPQSHFLLLSPTSAYTLGFCSSVAFPSFFFFFLFLKILMFNF